jgi:hypothetical protein
MQTHVIHDILHRASIALREQMHERTGASTVRVLFGDEAPIGYVPLAFEGHIGDVDLSGIGPALYQADVPLMDSLTVGMRAVGNNAAMARLLGRVYPEVNTAALRLLHPFAPLVHIAYQHAQASSMLVCCGQGDILRVPEIGLLVQPHRVEFDGIIRRAEHRCPTADMILRRPVGHYRRTPARLGAVYRAVLATMPDLAPQTRVLVTTAFIAGMSGLVTSQFDIHHLDRLAAHKDVWCDAFDLVERCRVAMPWRQLQTLVGHLMTPAEFRSHFRTPSAWAASTYTPAKQQEVMAKVVELQTLDAHREKFTAEELQERQAAFRLLQLQQQVR